MKKIRLVFGTFNSQPLGTSDEDLEIAYQKAYKPFLTTLYNLPEVTLTLHYSGILLQWFEDHHPEFLMLLNDMIKRKQIELLGGAFFEPILPLIPMADRIGQIETLTTFLRKRFGKRPRGCWVPERVWEPSLASMFSASGMDFVFLDDWHFLSANLSKEDLYAPCYTEDQGKLIAVFPMCAEVRRLIVDTSPQGALERLSAHISDEEDRTLVLMEDGAEYGLTGDSHNQCYTEGKLVAFLNALLERKDLFKFINPAKFIKYTKPEKKAYFPCTSYEEMMDWSLTTNARDSINKARITLGENGFDKGFLRGGHFRQFLTKYPESNFMYSKMLYTNILVNQIRGDKYRKKAAKEELWKGQSNNAYWFGRCGGIYSNRLRKSVYHSLLEAEKTTHEKGLFIPSIVTTDFDMDGKVEYLYQGYDMNAYIHVRGGMLFELDFLPVGWNYLDTMSRYEEDGGTAGVNGNCVDSYIRKAFIDHIFDREDGIEDFDRMRYRELGNFIGGVYEVTDLNREKNILDLTKNGRVESGGVKKPFLLQKKYHFKRTGLDVAYTLKNTGDLPVSFVFGCEINLALSNSDSSRFFVDCDGTGSAEMETGPAAVDNVREVIVRDDVNDVTINVSSAKSFELWSLPIETWVDTTKGREKQYQSSCFVPRWTLSLKPEEVWETKVVVNLTKN